MNVSQGDQPPFPLEQSIEAQATEDTRSTRERLRDAYEHLLYVQDPEGYRPPAPPEGTRAQRRAAKLAAGTTRWGRGRRR